VRSSSPVLTSPRGGRLAADKARATPDLADHRIERFVAVMRASIDSGRRDVVRHRCVSRSAARNARLADAGLSRQLHHLTLTIGGAAPAVSGAGATSCSRPTNLRHGLRARRLEPADVLDLANDRPGEKPEALKPLSSSGPSAFNSKVLPSNLRVDFGNHDGAGVGQISAAARRDSACPRRRRARAASPSPMSSPTTTRAG